jgi:uncharacterized protein
MRRYWRRWLVGVLVALLVVVVGVGYVGMQRAIHPHDSKEQHSLSEYAFTAETVAFASRDGTPLKGWFVRAGTQPAPTVVLLNGYGDSRSTSLPFAAFLHDGGYHVLLFDWRATGESGGDAVSLGAYEVGDALGALDYLATRPEVDQQRIGLEGVSMGAAVAILTAARDPRVIGVVAEAPFPDVISIIATEYEHTVHLPAFPFAPVTIALADLRLRTRIEQISPLHEVAALGQRPLFLMADGADAQIPPPLQQRLFEAASGPKQFWQIDGATHAHRHTVQRAEYERRVLAFWRGVFGQ